MGEVNEKWFCEVEIVIECFQFDNFCVWYYCVLYYYNYRLEL